MFKEKAVDFMRKHPKLTGAAVSTVSSFALAVPLAGSSIVASADDTDVVATATDTLVTSASTAFSDAITKVTPVLATVIGFNVVVRLVRRFIKG